MKDLEREILHPLLVFVFDGRRYLQAGVLDKVDGCSRDCFNFVHDVAAFVGCWVLVCRIYVDI